MNVRNENKRKIIFYFAGLFISILSVLPFIVLQEKACFTIGDFLDDEVIILKLNGKYFFTGIHTQVVEWLGGMHKASIQPSGFLLIWPFYFLGSLRGIQIIYLYDVIMAYTGMYLLASKTVKNKYAFLTAVCSFLFCFQPFYPQHGLSSLGFPLAIWAFWELAEKRRILLAYLAIAVFALSSSLIWSGYIIVGGAFIFAIVLTVRHFRKEARNVWMGFGLLVILYLFVNKDTLYNVLFSGVKSHRDDPGKIYFYRGFKESFVEIFKYGQFHVPSNHTYIMAGCFVILGVAGIYLLVRKIRRKESDKALSHLWIMGASLWMSAVFIAAFAAFYVTETGYKLRSHLGPLESIQLDRFYWGYPTLWYLELLICLVLALDMLKKYLNRKVHTAVMLVGTTGLLIVMSLYLIGKNEMLKVNLKQLCGKKVNNITYEQYYDHEVMDMVRDAIGKPQSEYRVGCLGMAPAVATENGFYTIDGYCTNYDLNYKYEFRRIMGNEIDKSEELHYYYDNWGSRVYLFSAELGTNWNFGKTDEAVIMHWDIDTSVLKELNCEYILSAVEVLNAEEIGLTLQGCYETPDSYRVIRIYEVR